MTDSSDLPYVVHFASGAISGGIAAFITCPLELVKTRMQSSFYGYNTLKAARLQEIQNPVLRFVCRST